VIPRKNGTTRSPKTAWMNDLEALVRTPWIREPLEDRVAEDLEVDDTSEEDGKRRPFEDPPSL
jgi:hypothetical protein